MEKNVLKIKKNAWHTNSVDFAYEKTNSSENGLTSFEARERLAKYGQNLLPQKKPKSILVMFVEELLNPIIIILLIAMAFSFIVGELLDGFVILGIILIDAIIGSIQSKRAERVASSLSNMIKVKAKVLRDDLKVEIDSLNLVIGDIVYLESGDKVSADMRIISCSNFTVDEALLTGESINSVKSDLTVKEDSAIGDRTNMTFAGSSVITGRATCVVVETGANTEIGTIATNLSNVKDEKSPLTIRIDKFSKQISIAIVLIAVVIFIIMLLQRNEFKDIFLCVIALSVSAMPEGLPLAVTMALTVSSNRMGKKNVVVKQLNAVESLGSCTVIATDKTGTLTLNEQTAKIIALPNNNEYEVTGSGYNDNGELICNNDKDYNTIFNLAMLGTINNEAKLTKQTEAFNYFGDSIDIAFLALGLKTKVDVKSIEVTHRIPYESENKYSAVFYEKESVNYCTCKGSLEKVLEFSGSMLINGDKVELNREQIIEQNEQLAKRGYRVIAIASGEFNDEGSNKEQDIKNLTFVGLVGFIDPVRPETKQAVTDCHNAGIKVVVITGDHPLTAYSIAQDIDIAHNFTEVATGIEVAEMFNKGENEFDEFVKTKTVFSRVTPTDKLNIVQSLKRCGEFVAVTGDGVNDSPAIKSAHIGIAMGSGTDVAKETADMIILDDNFNSIVEGVKEGRTAYSNIRKITYFLLACSITEVLFFILALISGTEAPLLAIQLLWLNIVTDGFQDLALSLEKPEKGIMNEKPRPTKESLFSKSMITQSVVMGGSMGLLVFVIWFVIYDIQRIDVVIARSLVMALMVFIQNNHAFNCRSEKQSILKVNPLSNWFFFVSILGSIGLQILFMEVPALSQLLSLNTVSYGWLAILLVVSLIVIVVNEIYKHFVRKYEQKLKTEAASKSID